MGLPGVTTRCCETPNVIIGRSRAIDAMCADGRAKYKMVPSHLKHDGHLKRGKESTLYPSFMGWESAVSGCEEGGTCLKGAHLIACESTAGSPAACSCGQGDVGTALAGPCPVQLGL